MSVPIAVVIPFYNGSEFIERSVESVLKQTLPADEFVIVNDGSKPKERDFLHDLAAKHQIKVIDQSNGGQGAARNTGVRATKSPYVCFLDQDDFYLRNHNKILAAMVPDDDPEFGWAYAESWRGDGAGNLVATQVISEYSNHPKIDIRQMIGCDMFCVPSMSIISRDAFEAVGGFDPQFLGYEDDDLFVRIFRKGYTNRYTTEPVTMWCIRPESTSGSFLMCRSRVRYFKKLARMFPDQKEAHQYYIRDFLIPRFHSPIVRDIIDSMMPDHRLYAHRDELLSLFDEYAEVVFATKSVRELFKRRLRAQVMILKTRNVPLIRMAHLLVAGWRATEALTKR